VFELEVEAVVVVLPLAGADVPEELVVVEVPDVEDVPEVLEVPLVEEVPVPVFAFGLALGSELPEQAVDRRIHDRTEIKAAHCNRVI
jgi:hypothetical protein